MSSSIRLQAHGEAHALYAMDLFVESPVDGQVQVRELIEALKEYPGVFVGDVPLGTDVTVPGNLIHVVSLMTRLEVLASYAGIPSPQQKVTEFLAKQAIIQRQRHLNPPLEGANLRGYQQVAVNRMLSQAGFILGDQMGLGKTRTVLAAAHQVVVGNRPLIVLGPKAVGTEWAAEAMRVGFCTEDQIYLCETRSPFDQKMPEWVRLIFCHYDIVEAWWPRLYSYRPKVAALDEAHIIRNTKTAKYRGASLVTRTCDYAWLMSGTPLLNRLGEYHTLLDVACGKWTFGGPGDFRIRYCGAVPTEYGRGLQDMEPTKVHELQQRTQYLYLRRTWADVPQVDVPAIDRKVVDTPISKAKRKRYDRYASALDMDKLLLALERGALGKETIKVLTKLRQVTSQAKLPATMAQVEELRDQNVPTVIFTAFRKIADTLAERIDKLDRTIVCRVHGGNRQRDRLAQLEVFRARSKECTDGDTYGVADERDVPFMVTTYGVFSAGVNLQAAYGLVLHDLDYVLANMLQAEGRVWRTGQKRMVLSRWMVAMETLDEMIIRLLSRKGRLAGAFLGDEASAHAGKILSEPLEQVDLSRMGDSVERMQKLRQQRYDESKRNV